MKQNVKLLTACLTAMAISGCGIDTVFTGCVTPDVARSVLNEEPQTNILKNAKRVVRNCQLLKQENQALREANEVCK